MRDPPWHSPDSVSASRQSRGAFALLLYLLAALVLPSLHLANHGYAHQHTALGLRLHPQGAAQLQHAETPEHDEQHEHHDAPVERALPLSFALRGPGPSHAPFDAAHGLGSLSHFALGVLAAAASPQLPAIFLWDLSVAVAAGREVAATPLLVAAHGPRGPPAAPVLHR
ncbi:MAG: hypothetical protein JNJ46_01860 [Myxococcales bacterium]|nr:hypothetical protein [Myxococcales bacterium]